MRTLIVCPCMDTVDTEFMTSFMGMKRVGETRFTIVRSSLIYDARNMLASQALSEGYDRILWVDSDMQIPSDMMERLSADMDEGREMVCGLYFGRKPPIAPVIFNKLVYELSEKNFEHDLQRYYDYPRDSIFPIVACGFGAVMMTTELIRKVANKFGYPFTPMMGLGEDIAFCWRVNQLEIPIYCDSRVKVGHYGVALYNENVYLNQLEIQKLKEEQSHEAEN